MIKTYFEILYNSFWISSWLFIPIILLFFIAVIFMIFMCILMFLDKLYRPDIPQYPFNLILDRMIPIIVLFIPSLTILIMKPFDTWFTRLVLLIIVHIFVLVPIFHYWSSLRRWDDIENLLMYQSWHNPRLYKHIAITGLYPLIWGLYFSLSRFLRLGSTYEVYAFITSLSPAFVVVPFILPPVYAYMVLTRQHQCISKIPVI